MKSKLYSDNDFPWIKNQIADLVLVLAAAISVPAIILISFSWFWFGSSIISLLQIGLLTLAIIFTFLKQRFSFKVKIVFSSVAILLLVIGSLFRLGFLSSAKMLLIALPVIMLYLFPLRKVLWFFVSVILLYAFIAFLWISHLLEFNYNLVEYAHNPISWILDLLHIIAICILFVAIFRIYSFSLMKQYNRLEQNSIEIAEKEKNYREIFNTSTDAIFMHDLSGKIVDVNNSMLQIYGFDRTEISSLNVNDLSLGKAPFSANEAKEYIHKAIKGQIQVFDWQARKKSGEIFWVEVVLKNTELGGKEHILAFVRDIDEKKRNAIQLEKYKNQLEELVKERTEELAVTNKELRSINEQLVIRTEKLEIALGQIKEAQHHVIQTEKMASIGVLTTGVAHEINNPLNYIQSGIYGLENMVNDDFSAEKYENSQEFIKTIITYMQSGVDRVAAIVERLNHFSSFNESNHLPCHLHQIIDNCLLMLNNKIVNRIDIIKNYTDEPFIVKGNEGRLHQAILNFLINSVDSILDKGKIIISSVLKSNFIEISIIDDGGGIKDEHIHRIFDPFYTTKEPGEGIGLGLSICYKVISEHGGSINIKSLPEKGTEAKIILPVSSLMDEE